MNVRKNALRLMVVRNATETEFAAQFAYRTAPLGSTGRKWDAMMDDGWWRGDGNEWVKVYKGISETHLSPDDYNYLSWDEIDSILRRETIRCVSVSTTRLRRVRSHLRITEASSFGGNVARRVRWLKDMRDEAERNAFEANVLLCSDMDQLAVTPGDEWDYTYNPETYGWDHSEPSGSFAFQNRASHELTFDDMDDCF